MEADREEDFHDFLTQGTLETIEELLGLGAILNERIALTNGTPVNTLTKMLHIFEMLHPKRIENLQVNFTLDFAHSIFAKFELFVGVEFFNGRERKLVAIFFFAHETNSFEKIVVEVENFLKIGDEVFVNTRTKLSKFGNLILVETRNFWTDIITIENAAAHSIDYFAVTIDNVIVLNDVLARVEVETFDAFLSLLKSLTDSLVADRHVIVDAKTLHQ